MAREGAYGVALDVDLSAELIAEGVAREVIRGVQELRKTAGLSVEDRIDLWLDTDSDVLAEALRSHTKLISSEVLATSSSIGDAPGDAAREQVTLDQGTVSAALKVSSAPQR